MKPVHTPGETVPLAQLLDRFVPEYHTFTYRPFVVRVRPWTDAFALETAKLSAKRAANRIATYVDPAEMDRVRTKLQTKDAASIRFGVRKTGHGFAGERGDFCLVGAAVRDRALSVFYRRFDLIGGLAYDLCVFAHLAQVLERTWSSVTIFAMQADSSARVGNSNEKLFPKLQSLFREGV